MISNLWHRIWYKHQAFEKGERGYLGMCSFRFFASTVDLVVRPEGMPDWQEPFRINDIEKTELRRILRAKDGAGLTRVVQEILTERKEADEWLEARKEGAGE